MAIACLLQVDMYFHSRDSQPPGNVPRVVLVWVLLACRNPTMHSSGGPFRSCHERKSGDVMEMHRFVWQEFVTAVHRDHFK